MIWIAALLACTSPSLDSATDTAEDQVPQGCPEWGAPESVGEVSNASLTEISGIVASRVHPNVIWAHEDSGAGPDLTALSLTGEVLATVSLTGVTAFDWEDISAAELNGTPSLVVADIGDNAAVRANLVLYVLPEPTALTNATVAAERLSLTYEDGARDAEALWVDGEEVWVITKRDSPARIYSAPLEHNAVLTLRGELPFGEAPLHGGTPTAADLDASGGVLTLRSYTHAWAWRKIPANTWTQTLASEPCEVSVAGEPQGEAITVSLDGDVYTVSENEPVLYRSPRIAE